MEWSGGEETDPEDNELLEDSAYLDDWEREALAEEDARHKAAAGLNTLEHFGYVSRRGLPDGAGWQGECAVFGDASNGGLERAVKFVPLGGGGPAWCAAAARGAQTPRHAALQQVRRAVREVRNLAVLNHIGVPRFVEARLCRHRGVPCLAIVMELARGGDLLGAISAGRLSGEMRAHQRRLFSQLVRTVADIHAQGILHRDLKLENILLDVEDVARANVKVCDFGLSKSAVNDSAPRSFSVGTAHLTAPEVLNNSGGAHPATRYPLSEGQHDASVDVWQLGCLLYAMHFRRFPFGLTRALTGLVSNILGGKFQDEYGNPNPVPRSASDGGDACEDLVSRMLVVEKAKRISLAEVTEHPYVAGLDVPLGWPADRRSREPAPKQSPEETDAVLRAAVHVWAPTAPAEEVRWVLGGSVVPAALSADRKSVV